VVPSHRDTIPCLEKAGIAGSNPGHEGEVVEKFASFEADRDARHTIGTVFWHAKRHGWQDMTAPPARPSDPRPAGRCPALSTGLITFKNCERTVADALDITPDHACAGFRRYSWPWMAAEGTHAARR